MDTALTIPAWTAGIFAVSSLAAALVAYLLWRIERHLHEINGRIGTSEDRIDKGEVWQDDRDTEAGRERSGH